jgi:molybdopterin adenylyltransferase
MRIPTGIITVSDRASQGRYEDLSGPALKRAAEGYGWQVIAEAVVADDRREIQRAIRKQAAKGCTLILTTGGTGISARDMTPEAVREIARCELPGFGEVMRMESLKLTPHAILSRSLAVAVDRTLVICLPGKPSAAVECLGFVAPSIPHAIEVLKGEQHHSTTDSHRVGNPKSETRNPKQTQNAGNEGRTKTKPENLSSL